MPEMPLNPEQAPNMFDAPVPGESLTATPGAMPFERPPHFTNIEEASEAMFVTLTKPRNVKMLVSSLNSGESAESIARTIAFEGAANGLWTPDMMLELARDRLLFTVVAIGEKNGVENLQYTNPDDELIEQLASTESLKQDPLPGLNSMEEEPIVEEEPMLDQPLLGVPEGEAPIGGLFDEGGV